MTLKSILQTQQNTLHLFLHHRSTRTPTIVIYVASLGGALHAAVTTYFYLSIGASTIQIGQLGFIMSVGALIGSPLSGWALDTYGPWIPISITAICCAVGCLWRGIASSITALRMGAILLGVGINLWTVVLAHLVKSFPSKLRSQVLSGFSVQITTLQLCGKGMFPIIEYMLHSVMKIEEELSRYRIHMGLCTFFCFYGVVALLVDRKNVGGETSMMMMNNETNTQQYKQKVSDSMEDDWQDDQITTSSSTKSKNNGNEEDVSISSSLSTFVNEPEDASLIRHQATITTTTPPHTKQKHLITTATLTIALLIQSISTTFLTVLWPLLSNDLFALSAHTFGIITFALSIVSTGAVASFPIVEGMERVGGRVRCAALGFGVGAMLCFLFCYCSFGGGGVAMDLLLGETLVNNNEMRDGSSNRLLGEDEDASILNADSIQQQLRSRNQLIMHAISAILFQSALCFLEPSLKSLLSLSLSSSKGTTRSKESSLGFTMGYLTMLGNIGGMIGNIAGTWMYKLSTEITDVSRFGQGGSLPFIVTGVLLSLSSIMIWRLDEPPAHITAFGSSNNSSNAKSFDGETEAGIDLELGSSSLNENDTARLESLEASEEDETSTSDGCCLTLRETTYDLKLD